jgi:hypothetical protein
LSIKAVTGYTRLTDTSAMVILPLDSSCQDSSGDNIYLIQIQRETVACNIGMESALTIHCMLLILAGTSRICHFMLRYGALIMKQTLIVCQECEH